MIELTLDNAGGFDPNTIYEWCVAVVSNRITNRTKYAVGTVIAVLLMGEKEKTPNKGERVSYDFEYREATVAQAVAWLQDKATKAAALDRANVAKARKAGRIG